MIVHQILFDFFLVVAASVGGYFIAARRFGIGVGLLLICVLYIWQDYQAAPVRPNPIALLKHAIIAYLSVAGALVGLLFRRRYRWAFVLAAVTVVLMSAPHLVGLAIAGRLEAQVLASELAENSPDLRGTRLVLIHDPRRCPFHLIDQFGLASLHCGTIGPYETRPPAIADMELYPPLDMPPDYVLVVTRQTRFSLRFPDLANLPFDRGVEGEGYVFSANRWPDPDSLLVRQFTAWYRPPTLGLPNIPGRYRILGLDQEPFPIFCAEPRWGPLFC